MYIFSLTPNSMAEEQTVLAVSFINSPTCNCQKISTIVDQVQIRQYYSFDAKVCTCPIVSTMCKDPLQKHAGQEAKHPTLCFSALKQYHAPKYMTDSNLKDDDDGENYGNGGEEAEAASANLEGLIEVIEIISILK